MNVNPQEIVEDKLKEEVRNYFENWMVLKRTDMLSWGSMWTSIITGSIRQLKFFDSFVRSAEKAWR